MASKPRLPVAYDVHALAEDARRALDDAVAAHDEAVQRPSNEARARLAASRAYLVRALDLALAGLAAGANARAEGRLL